jgi:hypothetical protein
MASMLLFSKPNPAIKVMYLIDQTVGAGCHNLREDVALVQFLLRAVLEDGPDYKLPPGPPLVIDGICGPETIKYIKSWQAQESAIATGAFKPLQDGQVSPALKHAWAGSISHQRYTIVGLNSIYAGVNGPDQHANIATDKRCPINLLPSIFWS